MPKPFNEEAVLKEFDKLSLNQAIEEYQKLGEKLHKRIEKQQEKIAGESKDLDNLKSKIK